MDATAAFLRAALPEPRIILHQRLKAYALGHEMILRRLESPFLCCQPYDRLTLEKKLFTAVFVCAHDYDEAWTGLQDPQLPAQFRAWRKLCGRFDLNEIALAFLQYLRDGRNNCPEFTRVQSRASSARPGAPLLLTLWQVLTGRLNFSRAEALACPYNLALWHYLGLRESQGAGYLRHGVLEQLRLQMKKLGLEPLRVHPVLN